MESESLGAVELAREYVRASAPLLAATTGVEHMAVFLDPDAEVARTEPAVWPAIRAAYVLGLLERSHLACVVTLARNHRWLSGMLGSLESSNLLSFSACLRGFLEAAADSHDVLQYLPLSLVEAREYFYAALHDPGQIERELSCGELENRLIHFAFARRQDKGANSPPNHSPKATTDYIRKIQSFGVEGAAALYSELCELTHPAAPSVDCFLVATSHNYTLNFGMDHQRIDDLLHRHNECLRKLILYSFNPALAGLAFIARLAPGWPAPKDGDLTGVPLVARNIGLFDALADQFGEATAVVEIQRAFSEMIGRGSTPTQ